MLYLITFIFLAMLVGATTYMFPYIREGKKIPRSFFILIVLYIPMNFLFVSAQGNHVSNWLGILVAILLSYYVILAVFLLYSWLKY